VGWCKLDGSDARVAGVSLAALAHKLTGFNSDIDVASGHEKLHSGSWVAGSIEGEAGFDVRRTFVDCLFAVWAVVLDRQVTHDAFVLIDEFTNREVDPAVRLAMTRRSRVGEVLREVGSESKKVLHFS